MAAATADDVASKLPSPLPLHSEMILAAITALDENNGSSKSAILKYIGATYMEMMQPSHQALLEAHMARMKESGELVMVKNNYMKPGSDVPPKRGRGRPPKPKVAAAEEAVEAPLSPELGPSTTRSRGRPPKSKDSLEAAVAKAATGFPRPRGRPAKKARPAVVAPASAADAGNAGSVLKRGRGRPPKILAAITPLDERNGPSHSALPEAHLARNDSMELVDVMVENYYLQPGPVVPLKRGRGRPKAKMAAEAVEAPVLPALDPPTPRSRGRPPKSKDTLAAADTKASGGFSHPRGRPPKKSRPTVAAPAPAVATAAGNPGSVVKRGRGRPPKVKPQFADAGFA